MFYDICLKESFQVQNILHRKIAIGFIIYGEKYVSKSKHESYSPFYLKLSYFQSTAEMYKN